MMNNLQKDLQENIEKYNGKHHLHKRVKVINCYHCYSISTEANISDNFIRFWNWISIFHSAKSYTSFTLFYFEKVIKVRAERNRNAIIRNIFEEKDIKTPKISPSALRSESPKITRKFKSKYLKSPRSSRIPKFEEEKEKPLEI